MPQSFPIENRPSETLATPETAPAMNAGGANPNEPEIDKVEPEGKTLQPEGEAKPDSAESKPASSEQNPESNVTAPKSEPGFTVKQQVAPSLEGRSMGVVGPK